jgi:predicted RNA-binding Zn ribbon-like protein
MNLSDRPAAAAKRISGRLCLDFVNSAGGWDVQERAGKRPLFTVHRDRLCDFTDVAAFALNAGIVDGPRSRRLLDLAAARPEKAAAAWKRAIELREAIRAIAWAFENSRKAPAEDLKILEKEIASARSRLSLRAGSSNLEWSLPGDPDLDTPSHHVALSADEYFRGADLSRLHSCPGDECGWLFEDTTKNRSRKWCDMGDCGNAAKVRDFRARSAGAKRRGARRSAQA